MLRNIKYWLFIIIKSVSSKSRIETQVLSTAKARFLAMIWNKLQGAGALPGDRSITRQAL